MAINQLEIENALAFGVCVWRLIVCALRTVPYVFDPCRKSLTHTIALINQCHYRNFNQLSTRKLWQFCAILKWTFWPVNGTVMSVPLLLTAKFRTNKMHFVFSRKYSEWKIPNEMDTHFKINSNRMLDCHYICFRATCIFSHLLAISLSANAPDEADSFFFCSSTINVYECDTISHFFALIFGAILCLKQNSKLRARILIHHLLFLLLN